MFGVIGGGSEQERLSEEDIGLFRQNDEIKRSEGTSV